MVAGVEATLGIGAPGPLLMLALVAGIWAGPVSGALVGAYAGLCDALLIGHSIAPLMLIGMLSGLGASLLPRWFSRHHLIVNMLAAITASIVFCCMQALASSIQIPDLLSWMLLSCAHNSLWMIAIYGIVLVVSFMHVGKSVSGE